MKALVCAEAGQPLALQVVPTPTAVHGSVIVKIIGAYFDDTIPFLLSGKGPFSFPKNLIPGSRAIARVAALGPDTTSLGVGQLVMLEPFLRARDNPRVEIIWGIFDGPTPASKKWAADNWSAAGYAEYCRAPLENCHALDERRLCGSAADGGLAYSPDDLLHLPTQLIAYAGLRSVNVQAGETVLVAPATGSYSGAAVQVAVAMGANVVAMGRNVAELKRLQDLFPGRVSIVQNTGDVEADAAALRRAGGEIDVYIDISPASANDSTHIRSCFMAVRQYGRVCLMGIISRDLAMPYQLAVWNNLTIKGQYMYEREYVQGLIKLAESGALKLGREGGVEIVGKFKLEELDKAIAASRATSGVGKLTILAP